MPRRLASWLDTNRAAAETLAAAVRELVTATVSALAPADALARATAAVRDALATLRAHVPDAKPARYPALESVSSPADVMPFDPLMGHLNPVAPPLRFAIADGRAMAEVRFGIAYEGPPGCVHGGVIAACFDQVLNVANLTAGVAGVTASLEIRYPRPTPLDADLRFETDAPEVDGRRVRTAGRLYCGDVVCAEATGIFVMVPLERVMALTRGRR
jgi:acyl-coenzyme A thioesterase PaaI-like protein